MWNFLSPRHPTGTTFFFLCVGVSETCGEEATAIATLCRLKTIFFMLYLRSKFSSSDVL
jgi:hypothetical protein